MKTILKLSTFITCAVLLMGGCATVEELATPENARTATTLLCVNAIQFSVEEGDRIEAANYVYAVAHAVRTLSGGKVPTQAELKAAIDLFTPDGTKWVTLATNISSIWGAIYPRISGNPAVALQYLEAIAGGCEDAAASFLPR